MTDQKQEESTEDTAADAPDFAATLLKLDKGRPHKRISEEFRDVVAAVAKTHKPGKLTITVTVKPQKDTDSGIVLVTAASKATTPAFDANASIFYATDEGELVRDDPKQHTLY